MKIDGWTFPSPTGPRRETKDRLFVEQGKYCQVGGSKKKGYKRCKY